MFFKLSSVFLGLVGIITPIFADSNDQKTIESLFLKSCANCHGNYIDNSGQVNQNLIKEKRQEILSFVCNSPLNPMPPLKAPISYQLDSLEIGRLCQAVTNLSVSQNTNPTNFPLEKIKMPQGFKISIYAIAKGARSLALGDNGIVYVGTGGFSNPESKVYALKDKNGDHYAETVETILDQQDNPNGVAFHHGDLYVAERWVIKKYRGVFSQIESGKPLKGEVIFDDFIRHQGTHSWKYLAIGPDERLYVSIGSPANVIDSDKQPSMSGHFARIWSMTTTGSDLRNVAMGVRNSVGLTWHPLTQELWFTDNGRDNLGNSLPPDELNVIASDKPSHFGYPYCHGSNIVDPDLNSNGSIFDCQLAATPRQNLSAHVAALGLRFYLGTMFPKEYHQQIFIAEHGSWNRSPLDGYRISLVKLDASGQSLSYETFASGWLREDGVTRLGRPVDLLNMPDGSLLVSDDMAGIVYRITYTGPF